IDQADAQNLFPYIFFSKYPDIYKVQRKLGGQVIEVLPTSIPTEISDRLSVQWHFVPRIQPVFLDGASPLESVRFAIVNFGQFCAQHPDQSALQRDRLELLGENWVLKLSPMKD